MTDKYTGKTMFCRCHARDVEVQGKANFSRAGVEVDLFSFKGGFHLYEKNEVVIQLEDREYVTLLSNVFSSSSGASAASVVYSKKITSYEAIMGFRPWTMNDRVRSMTFDLVNEGSVFIAQDIEENISRMRWEDTPTGTIICVKNAAHTIEIRRALYRNHVSKSFDTGGISCEVTFEQGKTFEDVGNVIAMLRTFFCFAASKNVSFVNYQILPTENSQVQLLDSDKTITSRFHLIWPQHEYEKSQERKSWTREVLRNWTPEDRVVFIDCLTRWITMWPKWRKPFSGMFLSFLQDNVFDGDRVLNACKWLESTPSAQPIATMSDSDINSLVEAATIKAKELNLDVLSRLDGAIRQVKIESRDALFVRLAEKVKPRISRFETDELVADLHAAFRLRGEFAHRKFEFSSSKDFGKHVRSIRAVEALSFLLLTDELPLPKNFTHSPGLHHFTQYFGDYLAMAPR